MLKRRLLVRIVTFVSALVIVLGACSWIGWHRAGLYEKYIQYSYQRSYGELSSALSRISSSLTKSAYSSTPAMTATLATSIWKDAETAQNLIGELPDDNESINLLSKYMAQIGAYAYSVANDTVTSQKISAEYRGNLGDLAAVTARLSTKMTEYGEHIQEKYKRGGFANFIMVVTGDTPPAFSLGDDMKAINDDFPQYPSLVYDGPYSDGIDEREALYLKDKETITKDAARSVVANILGISVSQVSVSGETSGKIPTWIVSATAGGGDIFAEVTKAGGHLQNLTCSREIKAANLTTEEAIDRAQEYLARMGYDNMSQTHWKIDANRIMIDFTYEEDNMRVYPDLVRIGIALDNGSLAMVKAGDYIMNHGRRTLDIPAVNMNSAISVLNQDLTLSGPGKLCLIPTSGQNEALCYEFAGSGADGNDYMVYISAADGTEQQFSMLSIDESGTTIF